jgi:hypothetical protein
MTYAEFSANKSARLELQKMLNSPIMSAVLDMLRDANLPKVLMQLPGAPAGMDPIHAIAISATHRAGFQHCISLLRQLPAMEPPADRQLHSAPWEYVAPPETATKKGRRKSL